MDDDVLTTRELGKLLEEAKVLEEKLAYMYGALEKRLAQSYGALDGLVRAVRAHPGVCDQCGAHAFDFDAALLRAENAVPISYSYLAICAVDTKALHDHDARGFVRLDALDAQEKNTPYRYLIVNLDNDQCSPTFTNKIRESMREDADRGLVMIVSLQGHTRYVSKKWRAVDIDKGGASEEEEKSITGRERGRYE
jgi:hypothetical protein